MSAAETGNPEAVSMRTRLRKAAATAFSETLRVRSGILLVLLVWHVAASVFLVNPGHYSIDEGVYHQMTRDFARSGTLETWTGYDEFPSKELKHKFHVERDGRLYPQYPYLSAVIAWPFYEALGYRGLFAMNAVAYIGIALLCFAMARRIFGDVALALDSVIILTIGTFAWEYSQAAWSHAPAVMAVTAALYLTVRGATETEDRRMTWFALAAGAVIGLAAGIRLDVVFSAPAVVLPYLLMAPSRLRPAVAALAGMLPGFAVLAATNHAKFGGLSPFTYGSTGGAAEPSAYLPVALLGFLGVAALWLTTRPRVLAIARQRPITAVGGLVLLAGLALLIPSVSRDVMRLASGASQILVDMRFRDPALLEPGMIRTASGAVVYYVGLKKALLQSLPWLPLLALPLAALFRPREEPARLIGILFMASAGYLAVYSYFAWHGGLALNMRYFLPFLPAFAILGAWGLQELAQDTPAAARRAAVYGFLVALNAVVFLIRGDLQTPEALEGVFLTLPLVLAAMLSGLLIARGIARHRPRRILSGASLVTAAVAMALAMAAALPYDYILASARRGGMAQTAQSVAPLIERDSIIFVLHELEYFGLYEKDRVRIAETPRDDFESFRPLLNFHLDAGRAVYLALGEDGMAIARRRGLLDGLSLTTLSESLIRVDPPGGRGT